MIVWSLIGALTSDLNAVLMALLSLTVFGLYVARYVDRTSAERDRQISLLPSLTTNQWACLSMSLKLASFGPRGKADRTSRPGVRSIRFLSGTWSTHVVPIGERTVSPRQRVVTFVN